MLQYPTNVYPADATFDANVNDNTNRIGFTFNGDIFTGALFKVYNYDTGEFVKDGAVKFYQNHSPQGYNSDEILSDTGVFGYTGHSPLINGTNYVFQLQLVQFTKDGSAPLCDMFVLRGDVQENYDSTTDYVTLKTNISNIYEWDTYSQDGARYPSHFWGVPAGIMQIVINGEKRDVVAYNPSNGHLMINPNTPFTTQITAGTKYQIYSNYIVTQAYYFQCRSVPTVNLSIEILDHGTTGDKSFGFYVSGNYSQANGSLINYYKLKLQWNWTLDDSAPWRTIDETEKIYSQNIAYEFFDDYVLRYKKIVNNEVVDVSAVEMGDVYYRAVIEVVTTDGTEIFVNSSYITDAKSTDDCPTTQIQELIAHNDDEPDVYYPKSIDGDIQLRINHPKHIISIRGGIVPPPAGTEPPPPFPEGTKYTYYRENLDTGEIRLLETVDDVTVPTRGRFRYYEIPRVLNSGGSTDRFSKGISYKDIELDGSQFNGYTITELILRGDEYQWGTKLRYKIGDQWKFVGDIGDTGITQNLDRNVHVGYNTYPKITSTKNNYLSGSLTAMNGYVDCTTKKYKDNIELIRAWREFISRQSIYMLKTQKGDVLVVGVEDSPTTTYSENIKEIPTSFTFNWIEVCDIDDIKVDYISENDPNNVY